MRKPFLCLPAFFRADPQRQPLTQWMTAIAHLATSQVTVEMIPCLLFYRRQKPSSQSLGDLFNVTLQACSRRGFRQASDHRGQAVMTHVSPTGTKAAPQTATDAAFFINTQQNHKISCVFKKLLFSFFSFFYLNNMFFIYFTFMCF